MAAIEALFASVNPAVAQGKDLQEALTKTIDAVAGMQGTVSSSSLGVRRALYPSIAQMFARMEKQGCDVPGDFDSSNLQRLLARPDVEVEAVRVLRTDAILAVKKASPALGEELGSGM